MTEWPPLTVGHLTEILGPSPKHRARECRDRDHHRGSHHRRCRDEADAPDRRDPQRREHQAADARPVVGRGQGRRPGALEPRRTIALTAAAPIATQPTPLRIAAAKSWAGVAAMAHPTTPAASASEPAGVTRETPKRRYSAGRLAITIAPTTKCAVTALDMRGNGQPVRWMTVCKYTGGP